MTATALAGIRPQPYAPREYAAFKAEQIGKRWVTSPLPTDGVSVNLEAAVAAAVIRCQHKQTLVIRENEDGAATFYIFVIRKKAPRWIAGDFGIGRQRVEDLYADLIAVLDGRAIAGLAPEGEPATGCEICGAI